MSSQDSSIKEGSGTADLAGRRVLVIEDSPVVGPFTADILEDLGCAVVGPAPNLAMARELIEEEDFDAALVDLHIRGERVFGLCEMLEAKDVPFILTSGYADWQMPDKLRDHPRLQKPHTIDQVRDALGALLASAD